MQFDCKHVNFRQPIVNIGRGEDLFFGTFNVNLEQVNFVKARIGKQFANGRRAEGGGVVGSRLERHKTPFAEASVFNADESFFIPQRGFYRVNVVVKSRVVAQEREIILLGLD